jgi:integrase
MAPVSTAAAAKEWAKSRERQLALFGKVEKPKPEKKEVPTLEEFAERLIGDGVAQNQKPSTIAAKRTILKTHLIPLLGSRRLNEIRNEDVSRLLQCLADRTPKTKNNTLTVLSVLLKKAIEWEDSTGLTKMPCKIKLLKVPKVKERPFHSFESYERLVRVAKGVGWRSYLIVLFGGDAGLRLGEIMALEQDDLRIWHDGVKWCGQITVARAEWKGQVGPPKGGQTRYVPMTQRLISAVRENQLRSNGRVVVQDDGSYMTMKTIQLSVARAAKRAGVKSGVHILRHTFCSHLAMKGAPARSIQQVAGHVDLATTQRYMHLQTGAVEAAIALLEGQVTGTMAAQAAENGQNAQIS